MGGSVLCEQRLHFRCVSCRAKSSLYRQPFNFLSCMRKIRHAIRKQNQSSGLSLNGASFAGITLLRYARLTQCSKPVKNGRKPVFKFIRPDFWTNLNGCRQRLLFARQLTQRKCGLCSQGRGNGESIKFQLIWWNQFVIYVREEEEKGAGLGEVHGYSSSPLLISKISYICS